MRSGWVGWRRAGMGSGEIGVGEAAPYATPPRSPHLSGSEHGGIKGVIDRFRADATGLLATLRRCLRNSHARVQAQLRGGKQGRLSMSMEDSFFDGAIHISKLLSPPVIKPYILVSSFRPNGKLQVLHDSKTQAAQPKLENPSSVPALPASSPVLSPSSHCLILRVKPQRRLRCR